MKTSAILTSAIVLAGAFCDQSYSQVQSWPPGGAAASPITAGMKLPGNRFVPSSKKYNLVWADELVGQPSAKIRFIAQNYVASQKMSSSQVAEYRTFNSNFICVIYHLSNGINPQNDNDCPLPHGTADITSCTPSGWVSEWSGYFEPWLASAGITNGSARFEVMFQHYTSADPNNRVWHSDPQWTMCLENADWRMYVADATIQWMVGLENEGCFFDVCVETMVPGLYNPAEGDPAPHSFNWCLSPYGPAGYTVASLSDFAVWMNGQYLGYWQSMYKRYHTSSADYLILPNVDQMTTGWYDPLWMDGSAAGETIDGAMMENFGNATGADMYLSLSRAVKHLTGRGKILIAQFYDSTQAERYRRTGMYMLIKNQNSFINILAPGAPGWFPEYEINLGDQSQAPTTIDALRVAGSGSASLFKRDYQNGIVLCNTSGSAINYALVGTNWTIVATSGGGSVDNNGAIARQSISVTPISSSQVSVPASGCTILTNNMAAVIAEPRKQSGESRFRPNPVNGVISINPAGDVSIYDLNGVLKIWNHSTHDHARVNVSALPGGVYIIKIVGANGLEKALFTYWK
jgi:Secretion system C-terminal sorting domain